MNKVAVQRQSRALLPELSEFFAGLPPFAGLRPFFDNHVLRMEDESRDGYYLVRTELPGVDPIEDLEVTVRDGQLTVRADRREANAPNGRSEFVYGTFERTVTLPGGADEDDIHATYDRGILTVSVPISDDEPTAKHVEVIETILVEDDDDDYDDDDDDGVDADDDDADADVPAERHDQQEQPVR